MKKNNLRAWIKELRGTESHYGRNKSCRIYLAAQLSIRKLHKIYNASTDNETLKVSIAMFQRIFCNEFNIGFRGPATDVCSMCVRLRAQIKSCKVASEKQELMLQLIVHKRRSKAFFEALREPDQEDSITYCFDMQQVQPLPKTPISEAFYARQISLYNLCITDVATQNPLFYMWTENLAGRGSVEVSSALINFLTNNVDNTGKKLLRLFCDGCGGQNKNNIVLHSLMYYLNHSNSAIEKIIIHFPVRGHSFLPADRVFGRVEKKIRTNAEIITPNEYYSTYEDFGEVKLLRRDWKLYDVKALSSLYSNLKEISEMKRIVIVKTYDRKKNSAIQVQGSKFYRFEETEHYDKLLKRGVTQQKTHEYSLQELPLHHVIKGDKKKDIQLLFK